jgi:hypothetical protein
MTYSKQIALSPAFMLHVLVFAVKIELSLMNFVVLAFAFGVRKLNHVEIRSSTLIKLFPRRLELNLLETASHSTLLHKGLMSFTFVPQETKANLESKADGNDREGDL